MLCTAGHRNFVVYSSKYRSNEVISTVAAPATTLIFGVLEYSIVVNTTLITQINRDSNAFARIKMIGIGKIVK